MHAGNASNERIAKILDRKQRKSSAIEMAKVYQMLGEDYKAEACLGMAMDVIQQEKAEDAKAKATESDEE